MIRLAPSHVHDVMEVVRTLDIDPGNAVEAIRNGIRVLHRKADGIAWDNPAMGGLLTYSFFADTLELDVAYGSPVGVEALADASSEDAPGPPADTDLTAVAAWLTEEVDDDRVPDLETAVTQKLSDAIDRVDWDIEAHTSYPYVETDDAYGVLEEWEFDEPGAYGFEAVDLVDDTLTVTRQIVASVRVHGSFSFSVKDGIDKDMVHMGSATAGRVIQVTVDAEFEFEGISVRRPVLRWIDIGPIDRYVDFGHVSPDSSDEDDHSQRDLDFGDE
jgi:hypothetical protein